MLKLADIKKDDFEEQDDIFLPSLISIEEFYVQLTAEIKNFKSGAKLSAGLVLQGQQVCIEINKVTAIFKQFLDTDARGLRVNKKTILNFIKFIVQLYQFVDSCLNQYEGVQTQRLELSNEAFAQLKQVIDCSLSLVVPIFESVKKLQQQFKNFFAKLPNTLVESFYKSLSYVVSLILADANFYRKNYSLAESYYLDFIDANASFVGSQGSDSQNARFEYQKATFHLRVAEIGVVTGWSEKVYANIERCFVGLMSLDSAAWKELQQEINQTVPLKVFILAESLNKARNFAASKRCYALFVEWIDQLQRSHPMVLKSSQQLVASQTKAKTNIANIDTFVFEKKIKNYFSALRDKKSDFLSKMEFQKVDYSIKIFFKNALVLDVFLQKLTAESLSVVVKTDKPNQRVTLEGVTASNYQALFRFVDNFFTEIVTPEFLSNMQARLVVVPAEVPSLSLATDFAEPCYPSPIKLPIKHKKKQPSAAEPVVVEQAAPIPFQPSLTWPRTNITYEVSGHSHIVPLSSMYIPEGSYFGYIDPSIWDQLLNDKENLRDTLEKLLERGKIVGQVGQGVKFIKKELRKEHPEYILKIKPLGMEGDNRLLGRIAETFTDKNGRHYHLIVFDLLFLNSHKESCQRIQVENRLGEVFSSTSVAPKI